MLHSVKAFNAFQVQDDSSREVLTFAEQAINELRQLLVPPSRPRESTSSRDTNISSRSPGSVRIPSQRAGPNPVTPARKTVRSTSESGKAVKPATTTVNGTSCDTSDVSFTDSPGVVKKRRSSGIPMTAFDDVARLASLLSK